jgi:hypothetical protein
MSVTVYGALAYVVLGRTEFPAAFDALGTAGVGVLLCLLGAAMAVGGLRRVVSLDEHEHGGETHSHPHLHLPVPGFDGHDHDHDAVSYPTTGLVGALFTRDIRSIRDGPFYLTDAKHGESIESVVERLHKALLES